MGQGTAGRRTSSDGDSVGSSRAELTCAAMRMKKSLEQGQADSRESRRSPDTTATTWPERGEADEQQQHPVCSLLKATGALSTHCSHGGLIVRAEQPGEAQELHGVTQARPKVPTAHGSPPTPSWLCSPGTQLQPHTSLHVPCQPNQPTGLTFPDPNSTGLRS